MSLITFDTAVHSLLVTGNVGDIEVLTVLGEPPQQPVIGVICHPLPTQGGTMHNKVVTTIYRAFAQLGIATLRFNFRGVGKSQGHYTGGEGEIADLMLLLNYIQAAYPQHAIWLAGFSFGSYVAAKAAVNWPVAQLVSIAPPVNHYDFTPVRELTCPWLIIQGDSDEIVPMAAVVTWLAQPARVTPQWIEFPQTGHFFHGKLVALRDTLVAALQSQLPAITTKVHQ